MATHESPDILTTAASHTRPPVVRPTLKRVPLATRAAAGPSEALARIVAPGPLTVSAFQSSV